jgi:ParB/RepB/Spo0J family partition protein
LPDILLSLIEFNGLFASRASEIEDIVSSFRREGQLSPIRVREHPTKAGKYEVVYGNRRLAAAKKLGWKTIAADVVRATDVETLVMAFSENVDRRDFSDYEKAELLQRLHDATGKNYTEVAAYIGRSTAFVSQHIAMLHLFPDGVASGKERSEVLHTLSENHARILGRIADDQQRWNTAKLVVSGNLGVRELQKICRDVSKKKEKEDDDGHLFRADNAEATMEEEEGEAASYESSSQKLREIVTNIIKALNSKDIRPFVGTVSTRHFSMFPRSSSPVVDRKNVNEHLFQVLRRMSKFKLSAPSYVDFHLYGDVAYVALELREEIGMQERKTIRAVSRATIIFEKEEKNSWKMVHSHWSMACPLEIDSRCVSPVSMINGKTFSA